MTGRVLSLCETVTAGPLTPNHVRWVGPEGLKVGGGLRGPALAALCGRDLAGGWDVRAVDVAELRRLARAGFDSGQQWVCESCTAEALGGRW